MEKKILLAVDDSLHSRHAARYAARISGWIRDLNYVLFSVQPMISIYLQDEARKKPMEKRKADRLAERNAEACRQVLESVKKEMVHAGIDEERITTESVPHRLGVAKDIIDYAQENRMDAVVMGRRGLGGLQNLFIGSVSNNVVQNSRVVPVWVVGADITPQRIMAAVDGSENSLRAIDHLSHMMAGQPDVRLVFFHVQPRLKDYCRIDFEDDGKKEELEAYVAQEDKACIDNFFNIAMKKLKSQGIAEGQVEFKTARGLVNPGAQIVKEAFASNFDTIVLGRSGIGRSFFSGSTSIYVLNRLDRHAVWIVP